jgi:hypothetical protein
MENIKLYKRKEDGQAQLIKIEYSRNQIERSRYKRKKIGR